MKMDGKHFISVVSNLEAGNKLNAGCMFERSRPLFKVKRERFENWRTVHLCGLSALD